MISTRSDSFSSLASVAVPDHGVGRKFQNPVAAGADPWVVQSGGWYYWCLSENMLGVAIYRSRTLAELGEKISTWSAPSSGSFCADVWAPELHFLDGRWYIYVAASSGKNETHRMFVLEADGELDQAEFRVKAELYTGDDIADGQSSRWAIDGTVLEHEGQRYFLWSGWEDDRDLQFLYIARMANPWTIATNRVRLCANDDHVWERVDETPHGRGLNEAPQVMRHRGRVFVAYSASASWATTYKLGMLELAADSDPMNPDNWTKHASPAFQATESTWGVGHCSFVRSADGREDWIAYHAKRETTPNWDRVIHVQRFHWSADGYPLFGLPVAAGIPLDVPSGDRAERETVQRAS